MPRGISAYHQKNGETIAERLDRQSHEGPGGCRLWDGAQRGKGYGQITIGRRSRAAHRVAWELVNGPVSSAAHICHRCDVRLCINPDHLFLGSGQDNVDDMVAKGRNAKGEKCGAAKLTEEHAREILKATGRHRDIGARFGVASTTVCEIKTRKTWKHLT